jgi:hypothetical protein
VSELGAGTVTVADIYREVIGMRTDVQRALTRVEVIDAKNANADQIHADHESRIRQLEVFRWKLTGLSVVLGMVAGVVSGIIANHVT